jgi:hypothetical protein
MCANADEYLFSRGTPVTGFQLPVHCIIPLLHDPLNYIFSVYFGLSSLHSPCHYSLRPPVIFHAFYMCNTISTCCFPCFVGNKQFCVTCISSLMTSLLSLVDWRSLQITSKNVPGHSQSQCPLKIGLLTNNAELLPFRYHIINWGR